MAFSRLNIFTKLAVSSSIILLVNYLVLSNGGSFCRSSFFTLRNNRYLPNHVIYSTLVTSLLECSMVCLTRDDCRSWNVEETFEGIKCELNNATIEIASQGHANLLIRKTAHFGQRITINTGNLKPVTYLFTSLDGKGNIGSTDTNGYVGTSLEGQVILNGGIQEWTVPHTGTYQIEALGASGANGTCAKINHSHGWQVGGLGAKMKGKFDLTKGIVLKILVGQSGRTSTQFGDRPGGGGGGTFVMLFNNTPLVISGGGGGGGGCIVKEGMSDGDPGQQGKLGSQCNGTLQQGGRLCPDGPQFGLYAGAGAGLLGNGEGAMFPIGSYAFVNGGNGGTCPVGSLGGFGGGGFGWLFGGGGGGYSGGGVWGNSSGGVAGGGGSYNSGYDVELGVCDSKGDGLVKIDLIA